MNAPLTNSLAALNLTAIVSSAAAMIYFVATNLVA
ncbi:MAG: hypothetical protein JWL81_1700 [Verrucomicrobiales bacterium]|nr:hypothetical protein [Verrucomicrobiales bacterium]